MVNNITHHNNTSLTTTLANGNIHSGLGQAQKCGRIKLVNGILTYFHYNKTLLEQKNPTQIGYAELQFSMGCIKMFWIAFINQNFNISELF